MKYDFDSFTDRHGSDCIKFDFTSERGKPGDVHSYWVADMDWPTAPVIVNAIVERAKQGIFGYTDVKPHYFNAVASWYSRRFAYSPKEGSLTVTPGVVFAIAAAIYAFTKEGEGVLIQNPVYYPFSETVEAQNRKLVVNELVNQNDSGYYVIDFDDFEKKIVEGNVKLFLLCSPHNPVGRVWKKEELLKMAEICLKHKVLILADEIHSDFVWGKNSHTVFPSLSKEIEDNTIWATAPTKTFNLAGLQVSNIFITNRELFRKYRVALDAFGYSQKSILGLTASEEAYKNPEAEDWFNQAAIYIEKNIDRLIEFVKKREPRIKILKPEGTYLVWLDIRDYGLTVKEQNALLVNKAKLWVDSGEIFGRCGEGFVRFNVCCPWKYLEEGLDALCTALH